MTTDKLYTGQRQEYEIGLSYYVARWYDSEIGHFLQADSVVPGIENSLAWNRFAYVNYNPMNHNDPTGHCDDGDSLYECLVKTIKKKARYWNGMPGERGYCYEGTAYADCFAGGDLLILETNHQIDEEELLELEIAVFGELESLNDNSFSILPRGASSLYGVENWDELVADLWAGRKAFDSPFYSGRESNSIVYYQGIPYTRNDVNYFAQGMWGARFGNSLEEVINISAEWKSRQYGEELSEGAVFWITKGYKDYIQFEQNMNIMFE